MLAAKKSSEPRISGLTQDLRSNAESALRSGLAECQRPGLSKCLSNLNPSHIPANDWTTWTTWTTWATWVTWVTWATSMAPARAQNNTLDPK